MSRQPHYRFGEAITPSEMTHVITRFAPKAKRHRGYGPVQQLHILKALHNTAPNLLAHEVNRKRGLAFDSGEAGFSHQRVGG